MTYSPWTYRLQDSTLPDVPTDDLLQAFGLAVRRLRVQQALSQEELAAAARLDRTYVSGLERGRRNPSLLTQQRVAKALNVPLSELVRDAEVVL